MLKYLYRTSKVADIDIISDLVCECFGVVALPYTINNLDNRYMLAFNEDKELIAMTGIHDSKDFKGKEVDWSCVKPEYRRKGILEYMLSTLLIRETEDVYASCWHISTKDYPNIGRVMKSLGFEEIVPKYTQCYSAYNKYCEHSCAAYKEGCTCWQDLYILKGSNIHA